MLFPPCHSRACFDEERSLYYCAHLRVHIGDGLVFPALCQACTKRLEPEPELKRTVATVFLDPSRFTRLLCKIAVVIPCHNYGSFVGEAIESVLGQSLKATEIVVVNDGSTDQSGEVARRYATAGVKLININARNVHNARRTGLEATESPVLCFLDADDCLPPDYLASGIREFHNRPDVGIVHSDLQCFGTSDAFLTFPQTADQATVNAENRIHAGSLVRRDALALSSALDVELPSKVASLTGDWWIWKCVLRDGWKATKQSSAYRYRRHPNSALQVAKDNRDYFSTAHLDREIITLFIPLSGRHTLWPKLKNFLDRQTWPHGQVQLVILDTSNDSTFEQMVRTWIANCDYADVRYVKRGFGEAGLADFPRSDAVSAVRRTMARIYNFLARSVLTNYVWVLEDDLLPVDDVCEQLMRQFDSTTGTVSAPYQSRYHDGMVAWDHFGRNLPRASSGIQNIGGNGFGCVVIRGELLKARVFTASPPYPDFDHEFYAHLRITPWKAKLHWGVEAEHRSDLSRQAQFADSAIEEAPAK